MKHQTLSHRTVVWLLLVVFAIMFSGCASLDGLDSKNWYIRETAVKKLTDQKLLAKIAIEDESFPVCKVAVDTLTIKQNISLWAEKYTDLKGWGFSGVTLIHTNGTEL